MTYTPSGIAAMIDHSLLQPTLTDRELDAGCELAARHGVASVCVKPFHVRRAAELLRGSKVAVGTVVAFPHGSHTTSMKRAETRESIANGASEIDMVANIGKALSSEWSFVEEDIRAVCEEAHQSGAIVKVIFENDFLPNDEVKIGLCRASERAAADFVKTSTGYGYTRQADGSFKTLGATEHDIKLMRAHCSSRVQVKAAGGVRDLGALLRLLALGATRFGASATEAILAECQRGPISSGGAPAASGY